MSFGSVPLGRTITRDPSASQIRSTSLGGRASNPSFRSSIRLTVTPPTAAGGVERRLAMMRSMSARSVTRSEIWSDAKWPNRSLNRSSWSAIVRPSAASDDARSRKATVGRDAVFVAHHVGVDEVAERLLEAVDESGRARHPFEAGERVLKVESVGRGDGLEGGRRNDGARQRSVRSAVGRRIRFGQFSGPPAEQSAHLVAGEAPVSVCDRGVRDGDGQAVRIRIVGDDQLDACLPGRSEGEIERTRAPPGWGTRRSETEGPVRSAPRRRPVELNPARSSTRAAVSHPTPCIAV